MKPATPAIPAQALLALTTRVTTGHVVCAVEGVTASALALAPTGGAFYLYGICLMLAGWLALARFRFGKLGADIGDLCFWDVVVWGVAGVCFAAGIGTTSAWYFMVSISVLKIYRVYAQAGSVTHENGWAVIGPMTYLHAKQTGMFTTPQKWWQMYRAFLLACAVGFLISVGDKYLSNMGRVIASWIIPLWFELFYGPKQVRTLQQFIPAFLASQQPATTPPLATPATDPATGQDQPTARQLPPDVLATLTEAYFATDPKLQEHLVGYAVKLAKGYPANKP